MVIATTAIVQIIKYAGIASNILPVISIGVGFLVVNTTVSFLVGPNIPMTQIASIGVLTGFCASGGFEAIRRVLKIIKGDFGINVGPGNVK